MIYVVGLGPGDPGRMSCEARELLQSGLPVLLRTERHPTTEHLAREGVAWTSCDDLYDTCPDFDAVYDAIAERVLRMAGQGPVVYAVPGHPVVGEESVRRVLLRASDQGTPVKIVGSSSFIEEALAAAGACLDQGLILADAASLDAVDLPPDVPALIYQVYDRDLASRVKLQLLRDRPADQEVVVVRHAGVQDEQQVLRIPLHRLDRVDADHLTSVYVPATPEEARRRTFGDLRKVMRRLRAPDGCPWDRAQTHATLRKWLIEECYETVDAIDRDDPDDLCEELGDLLLQIVFHAQIAEEEGVFDLDDVTDRIVRKLIRRHPHVFGDATAEDPAAVERNWEAIKTAEKGERRSVLDGVPASLPALQRATELGERAAGVGFDWRSVEDVLAKVEEELEEVRLSLRSGQRDEIAREIGDLLFAITNLARWVDVDPEEALRTMLGRFVERFQRIEEAARASGRRVSEMSLEEMDAIWNRAKEEMGPHQA